MLLYYATQNLPRMIIYRRLSNVAIDPNYPFLYELRL